MFLQSRALANDPLDHPHVPALILHVDLNEASFPLSFLQVGKNLGQRPYEWSRSNSVVFGQDGCIYIEMQYLLCMWRLQIN